MERFRYDPETAIAVSPAQQQTRHEAFEAKRKDLLEQVVAQESLLLWHFTKEGNSSSDKTVWHHVLGQLPRKQLQHFTFLYHVVSGMRKERVRTGKMAVPALATFSEATLVGLKAKQSGLKSDTRKSFFRMRSDLGVTDVDDWNSRSTAAVKAPACHVPKKDHKQIVKPHRSCNGRIRDIIKKDQRYYQKIKRKYNL